MEIIQQSIELQIFGNSIKNYYITFGFIIVVLAVFHFLQLKLLHRLESLSRRTKTSIDDILIEMLKKVPKIFFVAIVFLVAIRSFLHFPKDFEHLLDAVLLVLIIFEVVKLGLNGGLEVLKETHFGKNKTTFQGVSLIIKIFVWSVAFLVILSNLGFNITALATSLGIGGIAIALAVQNILGDLFASFTIYFDKPFEVGDWIEVGGKDGTVESIGLKTTRIRTLYGDTLVVSNRELTESKLQNYRMKYRQNTFSFVLPFDTPSKKLEKVGSIIETVCESNEGWENDWCRLIKIGEFGYEFETSIVFEYPDWYKYLEQLEKFNIGLIKAFEKNKLSFAYPTRKVIQDESK